MKDYFQMIYLLYNNVFNFFEQYYINIFIIITADIKIEQKTTRTCQDVYLNITRYKKHNDDV